MKSEDEDSGNTAVGFLLKNSFDGILVVRHGRIDYVNERFIELSGYTLEEMTSKDFNLENILQNNIIHEITKIAQDGDMDPIKSSLTTKNGNLTPVDIVIWKNAERDMTISTIRPLMDEDRMRSYLRESEDKFRTLVQNLPGVVYIYDQYPDGSRKRHFYGQTLSTLIGEFDEAEIGEDIDKFFELIPEEDMEDLQNEASKALEMERILNVEYRLIPRKGEPLWVRSIGKPVKLEDGVVRWQGVLLNITEKKSVEERSKQEKERAEFYLDLLTHDLGNMHQGIASWLELGMIQIENPERRDMAFKQAMGLVKSSMKMVRNLLLLNRIKERVPDPEEIKVKPMIEEAIREVEGIFHPRKISFEVIDKAPWATVEAEPLLKEVIFNLIHNGVKFQTGEEALITIRLLEDENGRIRVEIEDHGPGIPDRIKKRVFDRLFHASRKAQSGIGLSLVKELISRYDGEIWVEDRIEGDHDKGSRFVILLNKA